MILRQQDVFVAVELLVVHLVAFEQLLLRGLVLLLRHHLYAGKGRCAGKHALLGQVLGVRERPELVLEAGKDVRGRLGHLRLHKLLLSAVRVIIVVLRVRLRARSGLLACGLLHSLLLHLLLVRLK